MAAFRHCRTHLSLSSGSNAKQSSVVNCQEALLLIVRLLFIEFSATGAVVLYNNVVVSATQPFHGSLSSMLCLISGAAGQAGSPETVWGTEDLYGELRSGRQLHGCLQRSSRRRNPALWGRGLSRGRAEWPWPCGKQALKLNAGVKSPRTKKKVVQGREKPR